MPSIGRIYTEDFKQLKNSTNIATIIAIVSLMVSLIAVFLFFYQGQDSNTIDKNELAVLVIRNDIMDLTDLWEKRYAVNVMIFKEDKEIGVVITTANGEEGIDNAEIMEEAVRPRIESSAKKFDWLKDYIISITIL